MANDTHYEREAMLAAMDKMQEAWRDDSLSIEAAAAFCEGWQARAAWDGGEICETEPVRLPDKLACGCRPALQKWCYVHQPADEVCECGHDKDRHHDDADAWCGYWIDGCPCRNFRPAPQPDEYLAEKIARATKTWQGIDPDSVSDVQPPREGEDVIEAAKEFVFALENWEAYEDMKTSTSTSIPVEFMALCEVVERRFGARAGQPREDGVK